MSTQTLRVCDKTERNLPCRKPFFTACPLCDTDCCNDHARNSVTLSATLAGVFGTVKLFHLCDDCYAAGVSLRNDTVNDVLASLTATIIEKLRATLAEKALK